MKTKQQAPIEPFTIEEIDRELAAIDAQIANIQSLQQRRSDLYNMKVLMMRLRTGSLEGLDASRPRTNINRNATADYAALVLSTHGGELHVAQILKNMRDAGWLGSGNDEVDRDRIYSAMHRQKNKFEKVAASKWRLKK
jgi:HB1, ASXL, restriction endonuclease HTH domain